jgi:predicted O-linked N-acetylglucosamine transferase (SPINDLY family)
MLSPFNLKMISDSEEDCSTCARLWTKGLVGVPPLWTGERYRHDKIRIAYLSTDFRSHPVGTTIIAPLEQHDKNRFEITAISLTSAPDCPIRQRIGQAADRFVEIHKMDDEAVSTMLRELEIDIAVDLNGLTGARRSHILLRRPAPLQVSYLGYPGTTAMRSIDYIIADRDVIPGENHAFFTEKVAYLPNSYLPYDRQRQLSEATPSRSEEGLPDTGFVFTCFNRLSKIGPEVFDVWMRLLQAVEGSVLWIGSDDPTSMANLRHEAAIRGVAPERIVFARYKKRIEDHLARQRLGDLFLDTLPYNAHSTTADALWAGLPVLTCRGRSFQSRVAAGILRAIGLPELITTSLAEYEQRALALALDPGQRAVIRKKLADSRDTTAMFDAAGFTRGLEAVYTTMWERQQSGLAPESFSITGQS